MVEYDPKADLREVSDMREVSDNQKTSPHRLQGKMRSTLAVRYLGTSDELQRVIATARAAHVGTTR